MPRTPTLPRRRLPRDASLSAWLDEWHGIAVDTTGLDHTPTVAGDVRRFGEQLGPGRSSRAMAIVHVGMFEALNAGSPGRYRSMIDLTRGGQYPSLRAGDGTDRAEPVVGIGYVPDAGPSVWRPDPVSRIPLAIGAFWGEVRPFAIASASIHRVPPPPRLDSAAYATAFDEVQRLGGDSIATPTERSAQQTRIGIYWAYDGTPSLCAPPRLYNQIAHAFAHQRNLDVLETARLLALVNLSMADAGSGPSGLGDSNDATRGDPTFTPLGAPASNLAGPRSRSRRRATLVPVAGAAPRALSAVTTQMTPALEVRHVLIPSNPRRRSRRRPHHSRDIAARTGGQPGRCATQPR